MKLHHILLLSSSLLCSHTFAEQQPNNQADGYQLPDNPSLLRVLTFKAGQGLTKTGDAIQRGAENSSQSLKHGATHVGERIESGSETAIQFAKDKTQQAGNYTQKKFKQGKQALLGTNNKEPVPIEYAPLTSAPSTMDASSYSQ